MGARSSRRAERERKRRDIEDLIGEIAAAQLRSQEAEQRRQQRFEEERLRSEAETRAMKRELREMGRRVGELTGSWGRFSEDLLAPAIAAAMGDLGLRILDAAQRRKAFDEQEQVLGEIDLLLQGVHGEPERPVCVVVSVKTSARSPDVDLLIRDVERIHDLFPDLRPCERLGVLATVGLDDAVAKRALRKGLCIVRPGRKVAELAIPAGFEPRVWPAAE